VFTYEGWEREVSERLIKPEDAVYPFAANDEMIAWAKEKIQPFLTASPEMRLQALQHSFFDSGEFEFAYDEVRTLTAEQAFTARNGNCMSFTSLFVAISRGLGIDTFLIAVQRQPEVAKEDGLVVVNRHVVAGYRTASKVYIFDFYVTSTAPYVTQTIVDDVLASAIYHTNLGGLAIREGDFDTAFHHLEIATALSPEWAPGWVNLGVAHARSGEVEKALTAYQQALVAEEGNSSALTNMAHIYRELGREEEAHVALEAAANGTKNPFTLIAMADLEMAHGNYEDARGYLKRARWWYGKEPEVYDALARLAHLEGDPEKAQKHADKAAQLRRKAEASTGAARN
jgi:Flp pilus assembly protein TadD